VVKNRRRASTLAPLLRQLYRLIKQQAVGHNHYAFNQRTARAANLLRPAATVAKGLAQLRVPACAGMALRERRSVSS